jgi:hypothetical protein
MKTHDEQTFVSSVLQYAENPAHRRYLEIRTAGLLGQGNSRSIAVSLEEVCRVGAEVLSANAKPLAEALTRDLN